MVDIVTKRELPDEWDQMSKWRKRVWRHPDTPALKRQQNKEWRALPGNAERRKAYWESRKDYHRSLVRENTRKMRERMIAELGVAECRRIWREEKAKRMNDPEKKKKSYDAYRKWYGSQKGRKWKQGYKVISAANTRRYRKENPLTPLQRVVASMRARMCGLLRGQVTDKSAMRYVGCTVAFLKAHIESTWKNGMMWENYGNGINGQKHWNVDHITPLSKFDMSDMEERKKAMHWSNLRALWAKQNYSKHAKCGKPIGQLPLLLA